MSYSGELIKKIKDKYDDSVKYQEALKETDKMILDFFKDLESEISKEISLAHGKISFLYGDEAGYMGDDSIVQLNILSVDGKYKSILFTKKEENKINVIINDNKANPYNVITIKKRPCYEHQYCGVTEEGGVFTNDTLDEYLGKAFGDIKL